jgi:DNA-binding transcriptional ArsR family regulator
MEEDKVVLDRRSFEALAVDTRIQIMKSLKARRKTLSELSKEMGMSVSGVKEHLETLERADLIKKIDDGHKWKYYELSRKGAELVAPKELRVWVLLSISMVALVLSALTMFPIQIPENTGAQFTSAMPASQPTLAGSVENATDAPGLMKADTPVLAQTTSAESAHDETIPLIVAGISLVSMLACAGILLKNRIRPGRA